MKQTLTDSLVQIGSGGTGAITIAALPAENTYTQILQVLIAIISLIPSIRAIFKRKTTLQ